MRQMAKRFMPWLLLGSVLLVSVAWASDGWETVAHDEGILVERRREPGTTFYEVRASTHSPFPPSVIFATLWNHQEYVEFVPYLKKLEILKQSADEKVIYEQIKMPLFGLLSRDRQSSEQFAGLNRRYDEMQAEFALVSLTISETSQEEAL